MKLLVINGPNLNLIGRREADIYGDRSFEEYLGELRSKFIAHTIDYFQSNVEGEIIDSLQSAVGVYDGVVLNAGGYTHTSVAIADCVAAVSGLGLSTVEIHISNILAREEFRHVSLIAPRATGSIFGFGLLGYELAIESFIARQVKV